MISWLAVDVVALGFSCTHEQENMKQEHRSRLLGGGLKYCVQLWSPCTRRTRCCGSGARGGHSNDLRAGTPLLGGKDGRAGAVQPGEERRLWGDFRAAFQY